MILQRHSAPWVISSAPIVVGAVSIWHSMHRYSVYRDEFTPNLLSISFSLYQSLSTSLCFSLCSAFKLPRFMLVSRPGYVSFKQSQTAILVQSHYQQDLLGTFARQKSLLYSFYWFSDIQQLLEIC